LRHQGIEQKKKKSYPQITQIRADCLEEGIEASRHRGTEQRKAEELSTDYADLGRLFKRKRKAGREEFTWIYRMVRIREEEKQEENCE